MHAPKRFVEPPSSTSTSKQQTCLPYPPALGHPRFPIVPKTPICPPAPSDAANNAEPRTVEPKTANPKKRTPGYHASKQPKKRKSKSNPLAKPSPSITRARTMPKRERRVAGGHSPAHHLALPPISFPVVMVALPSPTAPPLLPLLPLFISLHGPLQRLQAVPIPIGISQHSGVPPAALGVGLLGLLSRGEGVAVRGQGVAC